MIYFLSLYIIGKLNNMSSLIEKNAKKSIAESEINKKNSDYSLAAFKKIPKTVTRERKKVQYGTLLNKIVESSIVENKDIQQAEQTAYDAINGQRQQENQQPEGITMLGQLNREKPLSAITREMIQEYQEEQNKPIMVDGEARKYMKADYEPSFPVPFDELKSTDEIDSLITIYRQGREDVSNKIGNIDRLIKETNDYILLLKKNVDETGQNLFSYKSEEANLNKLKQERKKLENKIDAYNYDLKKLDEDRKETLKQNELINQTNREEVKKYEQTLMQMNRNRLNLQQQPYESEYEYYNRLKEAERSKYDPVLYRQYAANEVTKKIKTDFTELFDDKSFIEDVIKNLDDEDKFVINKNFNAVERLFLDKFGFNNKSISPRMAAQELKNITDLIKNEALLLKQVKSAKDIQKMFRGKKGRIEAANERVKKEIRDQQQERFNRQTERLAQYEARQRAQQQLTRAQALAQTQSQAEQQSQMQQVRQAQQLARELRQRDRSQEQAAQAAKTLENAIRNRKIREKFKEELLDMQDKRFFDDAAKEYKVPILQAALKRRPQREIYSDTIQLARDRQGLEARQQEAAVQRQAEAARNIQKIFRGSEGRKKARDAASAVQKQQQQARQDTFDDYREFAREEAAQKQKKEKRIIERQLLNKALAEGQQQQQQQARDQISSAILRSISQPKLANTLDALDEERFNRLTQRLSQNEKRIREEEKAARNIQKVFRGSKDRKIALAEGQKQQIATKQEKTKKAKELLSQIKDYGTSLQIQQIPKKSREEFSLFGEKEIEEFERKEKLKQDIKNKALQRYSILPIQGSIKPQLLETQKKANKKMARDIIDDIIENAIIENAIIEKDELSPTPSMMSMRSTILGQAKRKQRSDKGQKREPYNYDELKPVGRPKNPRNPVGRPRKVVPENTQGAKGAGFLSKYRNKPNKRVVKVSPEEKMKNRLRLVASQVKAGNDNPKIILELNALYEKLYNIPNAYNMIKK